jgi:hypothetical protein
MAPHTAARIWSMLILALGLALTTVEAATSYTFKGFDAPLPGVVSTTITGVDYASGVLMGRYTDVYGNKHGWRGNGRDNHPYRNRR